MNDLRSTLATAHPELTDDQLEHAEAAAQRFGLAFPHIDWTIALPAIIALLKALGVLKASV